MIETIQRFSVLLLKPTPIVDYNSPNYASDFKNYVCRGDGVLAIFLGKFSYPIPHALAVLGPEFVPKTHLLQFTALVQNGLPTRIRAQVAADPASEANFPANGFQWILIERF